MKTGELIGFGGGEIGVLSGVGRREVRCRLCSFLDAYMYTKLTPILIVPCANQVRVHRKPKIAILSTGSELIDLSGPSPNSSSTQEPRSASDPSWSGIYDSNRPSLKILIESMGWEVLDLGVVRDEFVSTFFSFLVGVAWLTLRSLLG